MNLLPMTRIKTALEQIDLVKEKRSELDFGRIAVEPPRAMRKPPAMSRPTRRWCLPSRSAQIRARWPKSCAKIEGRSRRRRRIGRRPWLHQHQDRRLGYWQRLLASMISSGTSYGRSTMGEGRKVNVVRFSRDFHAFDLRAGHCRKRRRRRRAGQPLVLRRLRHHQGILHQRCRLADRRAGALRVPALSRGARRRSARSRPVSIRAITWCSRRVTGA